MTQGLAIEAVVRSRLRGLRIARGWSLNELAERCYMSPSTISRIETGQQRVSLDQLATISAALGSSLDQIVESADDQSVVITPHIDAERGLTTWMMNQEPDKDGMVVAKFRITRPAPKPDEGALKVHPGRDWFVVLSGTIELLLADRVLTVETGQAAAFSTMTPHAVGAVGGPAEVLAILDSNGQRHHAGD
jgi:transcriptional regulator with XRE-family HTH domain